MWGHARLVSLVLFRYPIMPNGDFGPVFVHGFADVRAFDAVRIRLVGVVPRWGRVLVGGTWVGVAHCWLPLV